MRAWRPVLGCAAGWGHAVNHKSGRQELSTQRPRGDMEDDGVLIDIEKIFSRLADYNTFQPALCSLTKVCTESLLCSLCSGDK